MAAGEAPQLHADGDLDGGRGEVLLLLAGLQLNQHLVELSEETSVSAPPSQRRLPSGPPRMCPRVTPVSSSLVTLMCIALQIPVKRCLRPAVLSPLWRLGWGGVTGREWPRLFPGAPWWQRQGPEEGWVSISFSLFKPP